jgi:C1A family cysteine protease
LRKRTRFLPLSLCALACLLDCKPGSGHSRPQQQPSQPATSAEDQLKKQNSELQEKLDQYKKLEEDLVAQRIADKAQAQAMWWLKLGGLATLILGLVGYKVIYDYGKNLVDREVDKLLKEEIKDVLLKEGYDQVTKFVDALKTDLVQSARQQIDHIKTSTEPAAAKELSSEPLFAAGATPANLKRLDYTSLLPPVRDAGPEGSVVGFALAATLEFQIRKELHQEIILSPRFIYYCAQERDGTIGTDSGAKISTAISVLKSVGAVAEAVWPYKPGKFGEKPPEALKTARHYRVKKSIRLNTLDEIKAGLQTYGPVVTGVTVYASVMTEEVRKTGRFPLPGPSDSVVGGHALCLVGYDDQSEYFKARNSWGAQWGDRGYAYVPYAYADRFFSDTYAITLWLTKGDLEARESPIEA